jgi:hypothetical protein
MSTLKACQKLPQAEREVWEGGCIKLPNWVTDKSETPFRPVMAIWIDLQSGMIIGHELGKAAPAPEEFLKQLLRAMARPQMGTARRPTHLCLKEAALAEQVRGPLASLGITVEVIDRFIALDKIVGMLAKAMELEDGNRPFPSLLKVPGVTHEYAEHFFHVAAEFYRQAPWQDLDDRAHIQIECPHFFRERLYFVVMGNAGLEFGLGLFPTAEEIDLLYSIGVPEGETVPPVRTASLLFSEPVYIGFEDLDAIEQYGWELAAPHAYPHIFKISPQRNPPLRSPSFALVQAFEAVLLTLPAFIAKNKTKIKNEKSCSGSATAKTFHGDWPLRMRID